MDEQNSDKLVRTGDRTREHIGIGIYSATENP